MAEFKGIFPAPKLKPMEFGLFSVNKGGPEITGKSEVAERWVRGFEVDLESRPNYVRSWSETSLVSDVVYSDPNAPRYLEVRPWFIEVEDKATTMGLLGLNRFERVLRQLEAVTQRTVEREFYEGNIARGAGLTTNTFLVDEDTAVVFGTGGATAVPPHHAIAYLERGIGNNSASGEQGVLHITRDVAALLGSQYMLMRIDDDPNHIHIETNSGTTVIVGAGYTGNGIAYSIATTSAVSGTSFTLTTNKAHYISVGETVKISGLTGAQATLNGSYTAVTGTTGSTIVVTLPSSQTVAGNSSVATGAYAQMQPSAEHKWIYATGTIRIFLGESEVVNDNLAQAYDVTGNQNDMRIKATRPVAAFFDTSIHLAVKVDVSTTAI
jgi:hypothetical protein